MDWNEDAIALLRRLWDEGLSTAEIGRRMQVTKNAVVGKAHRLDLPARPSPIRKGVEAAVGAAVAAASAPAVRDGTALDDGVVAAPAMPRRAAEVVVTLPVAEAPDRKAAERPAVERPAAGSGTVHVLRPTLPPAPRSAEPEAIPDAVVERMVASSEAAAPGSGSERGVAEPAAAGKPAAERVVSAERAMAGSAGAAPRRRGLTCCWPLGEPGTKEFRFCGADPVAGKPYCAEHAALAYVKVRDRRDSVA